MRVLVLNYEHPPLGGGGGRLAAKVADGLVRKGHHVRIVTAGMPHLPLESVEEGIEVRRLRSFRRREDTCSVPEMALWVIEAIPAAIAEVHRWKPDVIHAHFAVPTGAVAWVVQKVTRVPYVLTAHLGDVPGGVPEQTESLFRWIKPFTIPIWRSASATTAVSGFVAGLARNAYGVEPRVILNGMQLPTPTEIETGKPARLLMAGRMSVQKNPLTAIRSLGLIKELAWQCRVIGEGPLLASMKLEAEQLGISDRIDFMGWQTGAEVSAAMRESDLLLLPSLSEGLPMVAVEALANGLAIVGSRIDGLADVAEEGSNARLFDLKEGAKGLASALQVLLEDPEALKSARRASLSMSTRFDFNSTLDHYEAVLQESAPA